MESQFQARPSRGPSSSCRDQSLSITQASGYISFFCKTDTIDTRALALFAMHVGPRPTPPPSVEVEALKELVAVNPSRI